MRYGKAQKENNLSITKIAGWITSFGVILSALVWALADNLESYIIRTVAEADPMTSECIAFQRYGNRISPARPGEETEITWTNLRKLQNCGAPEVSTVMYDSNGVIFNPPINTINLPLGVKERLTYRLKIPEDAAPGRAEFFITFKYQVEETPVNSPSIVFFILPPLEDDDNGPEEERVILPQAALRNEETDDLINDTDWPTRPR